MTFTEQIQREREREDYQNLFIFVRRTEINLKNLKIQRAKSIYFFDSHTLFLLTSAKSNFKRSEQFRKFKFIPVGDRRPNPSEISNFRVCIGKENQPVDRSCRFSTHLASQPTGTLPNHSNHSNFVEHNVLLPSGANSTSNFITFTRTPVFGAETNERRVDSVVTIFLFLDCFVVNFVEPMLFVPFQLAPTFSPSCSSGLRSSRSTQNV